MKKITVILLLFSAFVLTSCGSDDPKGTPTQKTIQTQWKIPVLGFAGQSVTLATTEIKLSDVSGIDAKNFISAEFQNTSSHIQISGLNKLDGVVLNNFTIQINNSAATNFGMVTATPGPNDFGSDVLQSGNKELTFLGSLFTAYTGKSQTATLKINFTPNKDIVTNDNVNLILTINGKYNWNIFN